MKYILLALLLTACSTVKTVPVPVYGAVIRQNVNPYAPSPEETERAFALFEKRASEVFDLSQGEVHAILSRVALTYSADPLPGSNDTMLVTGITTHKYTVQVYCDETRHDVSTNALIHELVHVVLWASGGNPGPEHEAPGSPWTHVHTIWVDSVMQELGGRQSEAVHGKTI